MIDADEFLERLVKGIQCNLDPDAVVCWSEKIQGRQFDVSVRFRAGNLDYLVLFEVKNKSRRASAQDIEAFVTKARDQNANKIVFVTKAGFQKSAIDVAKRHNVSLFTVGFDESNIAPIGNSTWFMPASGEIKYQADLDVHFGAPVEVNSIASVTLVYSDGQRHKLPEEQSQLVGCLKRTKFESGESLLEHVLSLPMPASKLNEPIFVVMDLKEQAKITPQDEYFFPGGMLARISLELVRVVGRPMSGTSRIDPNTTVCPVIYTNAVSGEVLRFPVEALPIGVNKIEKGKFYFTLFPLSYFYCKAIHGEELEFVLVESFQNGILFQAIIRQHSSYSYLYFPVVDKKVLTRLQLRLRDYSR
jgi:Restriction endonuclease